ncbi:MAG TPA: hypothetical protein VFY04_07650 [Solirubrobacterales bacterium]|nr:hypothetical protein [Solirubrobacterales bacterium]
MIRNLKTLGLAMVAALALSAVAASTASAELEGGFTAENGTYPLHVHGVDGEGTNALTAGGAPVECEEASYTGTLAEPSPTLKLDLSFENCVAGALTATVTVNGCTYDFHVGTGTGNGDWHGEAGLTCPSKPLEIHFYNAKPHSAATEVCTVTIGTQKNLKGLTLTDLGNNTVTAEGSVGGIKGHRSGACVGGATVPFEGAVLDADITVTGTNDNLDIG